MQIETLDRQTALDRVGMSYPYLMIRTPGDPIALVVPQLEYGDMPLLCSVDGVLYKVGSIFKSALTIHTLLRVTALDYYRDANTVIQLKSADDIMTAIRE